MRSRSPTPISRPRALGRIDRRMLFALHAAIVIALAIWVRTLSVEPGIATTVGLLVAGIVAWRAGRRGATIALLLVGAATGVVVHDQWRTRTEISNDTPSAIAGASAAYARNVAAAIQDAQATLDWAAARAAGGTSPAASLPPMRSDAGVVVYEGNRATGWAGRVVVPTDPLWERRGVIVTPAYVVQYATALRGDRRAVATNVVDAAPPADHLANSVVDGATTDGAADVYISVTAAGARDTGVAVDVGGARITVAAHLASVERRLARADETARFRGTALLAIATLVVLLTLWRRAEGLAERLITVAVPLVALAVTPLNTLSNVTRLFDPSTYFVASGGPFTASVGALAITSALALFTVMAALRGRVRPGQRLGAALVVLVIAGLGPFLLRDLARGVAIPPSGAGTGLWLAWEVALFLAATSLLAAGITAGQWALGARRGVPLWIAPAFGATAALLAPILLGEGGSFPGWYPVLWVVAIGALALARRSRAVVLPSAIVAACGSTVLIWSATIRERVELARADVSGLSVVDNTAAALLQRVAADLERGPAPTSQADLLARYAATDLAAAEYPVSLASWPVAGPPVVLRMGADERLADVAPIVQVTRTTGTTELHAIAPAPISALVLAVPHSAGDVTTVLVGARTRLLPARAYAELLGFPAVAAQAPYRLALAEPALVPDTGRTRWERRGDRLHADWALPTTTGRPARVYADVSFDSYDTLLTRGVLVVLFDLFVVLVLLAGDLLAEGTLLRWIRMRRRRWARSYRLRITVALLAFFVVPALAFAVWSYSRLQSDDRAARDLMLRESLRRAQLEYPAARSAMEVPPPVIDIPNDIPMFTYVRGQLVGASDSLLLALAPAGRWLSADVQRALASGEDLVATSNVMIGGRPTLFGFRALTPDVVVAVPGRHEDAALDKRRSDLGVLVILSTVLGALAALGLSGVAARQLERPIGELRSAALAVAGGSRAPLRSVDAPAEFQPVFQAFDRMARELAASEAQLTRAERVLAWGEMARQVAHEIKNPLTPIRLGVQHLLRAWRDRRPDFGEILEENSDRVLREIDHLDATARSFSRYGTAPDTPPGATLVAAADAVDVAAVARDVAALEALGADGVAWSTAGTESARWARARVDELREVLLNLCENSRLAGARGVQLAVARDDGYVNVDVVDDGEGVSPDVRSRVFDPHFSTRTSGTGLGLAISRRLVEGWGGTIELTSDVGAGTRVRLRLIAAEREGV